jgi:hypothetical protein
LEVGFYTQKKTWKFKKNFMKILLSIFTILICTTGSYFFCKNYIGKIHIHPPTKNDINKIRKDLQKATRQKNPPFIREKQKENKYEHPKRFRIHHN